MLRLLLRLLGMLLGLLMLSRGPLRSLRIRCLMRLQRLKVVQLLCFDVALGTTRGQLLLRTRLIRTVQWRLLRIWKQGPRQHRLRLLVRQLLDCGQLRWRLCMHLALSKMRLRVRVMPTTRLLRVELLVQLLEGLPLRRQRGLLRRG
jgi:hypothetical protein